jgi:hypothetical protein
MEEFHRVELLRITYRKHLQQQCIQGTEDGGIRTDA